MYPITEHHHHDPRNPFPEVEKYLTPVNFIPSCPLSPSISITHNLERLKDPKGTQPLSKLENLREKTFFNEESRRT